jgi:membrane-associated protease RseP (regulator of RpoE activity)
VTNIADTQPQTESAPSPAPEPTASPAGPAPVGAPDRRLTLALVIGLVLFIALVGGWPLLLVIVAFVVMIVLHELGHYIVAKKSGMKVTEFFLGFGPKLWSFRRGETEYGVKALPAGAYVRIIGMHNLDEVPPEDEPRTYRQQSYPKRLGVAVAGSTMHFLQALVAMFLVFAVFGAPGGHLFTHTDDFRIKETVPGSAAEHAGIQPGDKVVSIDGQQIKSFDQLHDVVIPRAGKLVPIVVERNGEQVTTEATIGTSDGHGFLGVEQTALPSERVSPITAAGRTVTEFGHVTKETFGFFGAFFSPSGLSHFADTVVNAGSTTSSQSDNSTTAPSGSGSGSSTVDENRPISIIGAGRIGAEIASKGAFAFLAFFASINIMIGIFNLIPLLPLDGGHVVIATYERIRSRKGRPYHADVMKMMPIAYAVVMVLVVLGAATIFLDIVNPIHLN